MEEIKILTTARPDAPKNNSTLPTPAGRADVTVVTMTWYAQVGVRVLRTFLQSWLGFIIGVGTGAADAVGIHVPVGDFLNLLLQSAGLAVAPAVISLLQNAIELLAKMDVTAPERRA